MLTIVFSICTFRSNFIFILSDCPHNSGDLATFSCNPNIDAVYDVKDVVKKLFLPDDLLIQLTKFNIGLHWVDTNPWSPEEQVCIGVNCMYRANCMHKMETTVRL